MKTDLDWVFPDTAEGIQGALNAARAVGWTYFDLLQKMIDTRWEF